jgi:hypothetical protein
VKVDDDDNLNKALKHLQSTGPVLRHIEGYGKPAWVHGGTLGLNRGKMFEVL